MTDPGARPPFPRRAFWILAASALVLRIGTSLSRVDENFGEGLYRGTLAKALIDGVTLWPSHVPEIPHVRGSVVIGVLAAPFYALLGPTTFALRLTGILFHLAGLWTWMLLVHRRLGARAAILGGALFVFAPPGFAKMAVLSYGDHTESLPFFLGAAILALEWLAPRNAPQRIGLAAATGLLAGLAVGFHAQAMLGVAALGPVCFALAPLAFLRRDLWLGFVPGLAAGFAPLLAGNAITHRNALLLFGKNPTAHLAEGQLSARASKWLAFWRDDLSTSFQLPSRALADATLLLAAACAAVLAVRCWSRWRRGEMTARAWIADVGFFVAYPLVFSVVFASSPFEILPNGRNALEVRYVLPALPFLLLPIAIASARLAEAGRRGAAAAVAAPALALGVYGSLSTWDVATMLREPARRGYHWEEFDEHLPYGSLAPAERAALRELEAQVAGEGDRDARLRAFLETNVDGERALDVIARVDDGPSWTWPLRWIPPRIPIGAPPIDAPDAIAKWIASKPERLRPFAAAAAGDALAGAQPFAGEIAGRAANALASPPIRQAYARGFGHGLLASAPFGRVRFFRADEAVARLRALASDADRDEARFGFGFRVGKLVTEFYAEGDELLRTIPALPELGGAAFARGLGAGYRMRFLKEPRADLESPAVRRLLGFLPAAWQPPFREGLGGGSAAR